MNTCLLSVLCLLGVWAILADGVIVQDGDLSFPLESVKKLKDLRELPKPRLWSRRKSAPMHGELQAPWICNSPELPEELQPVCKRPDAHEILQRLEAIAQDPSTCEICAYAACAGC